MVHGGPKGNTRCSVTEQGLLWCWGANTHRIIANEARIDFERPQYIPTPGPLLDLIIGEDYLCGLTQSQHLICRGQNAKGALGMPNSEAAWQDWAPVSEQADWVQISGQRQTPCALNASGDLYCWGDNSYGGLGNGSFAPVSYGYVFGDNVAAGAAATADSTFNNNWLGANAVDGELGSGQGQAWCSRLRWGLLP